MREVDNVKQHDSGSLMYDTCHSFFAIKKRGKKAENGKQTLYIFFKLYNWWNEVNQKRNVRDTLKVALLPNQTIAVVKRNMTHHVFLIFVSLY